MKSYQLSIKKYSSYKDSTIEWIGEMPEHWSLSRIKSLTKTKSGTTPQSGLSQYYDNGIYFWVRTTDLNNNRLHSSEFKVTAVAREHYNLISIPIGSVLLAMYGGMGTIGKNAILQQEVTINQSVCAIFPNNKKFVSEHLWYYIQYFRPHWEIFADSARKDPNINQEAIKRLWVPLPPLSQQKTIATYLDTKTAQIDRKINLLTQKAKSYADLKRSIINGTVTRGLDRSVTMKDSEIDWIGEIPEHWGIYHLKNIVSTKITDGPHETPTFTNDGVPFVSAEAVQNGAVNFDSKRGYISEETDKVYSLKCKPKRDDIFIVKSGSTTGKVGYVSTDMNFNIWSPLALVRTNKINYSRYLFYFLSSSFFQKQVQMYWSLGTQPNIGMKVLENLQIVKPPLTQQKSIATYLDTKTVQIDQIIQNINTQIEKLKELRKTLINDVVTGKIKVPEPQ